MITYKDRVTPVQLGDRVETRIWSRRPGGRVVCIPGVSPLNGSRLRFVRRDSEGVAELKPEEDPHGDDSFAAPF